MNKVWVVKECPDDSTYIIGVTSVNDQRAVVSLLHDKGCITDNDGFIEEFGYDYIDKIAALPREEFLSLLERGCLEIEECSFYGKLL